ncbi:SpoIID/LytB domain-containing protein [Dokdonella sp.]|uniref:SpoIID/LytB domain-containing protein n=1 Tax=Dokdonella sp. TaxID=2291710 RepID=UPI002F42C75A
MTTPNRCWTAWLVLACAGALPTHAAELAVRDATTGASLDARARQLDAFAADGPILLDGRLRRYPLASPARLRIEAPGHRPVEIALDGGDAPITILLDPLAPPVAYERLARMSEARPHARWLQGFARQGDDGLALAGAVVEIEGHRATTDASGYFELELDPVDADAAPTDRATLRAHADSHADIVREGLARLAGVQRVLLAFGGDTAPRATIEIGARDRAEGAVVAADAASSSAASIARTFAPPGGAALAPALAPPTTIRVGYADAACTQSCCTGACTHTCVLPLESYVGRGLDSEWIASWNTQSLRAGSVAYRSYGAWRVAHPISANFDICSSACCQVNDAGTSASTDAAVARTPGLMLTRGGSEAASAEYSAENNSWDDPADGLSCSNADLTCGDGYAGSPASGWPCLADPVGAGHGCFGPGRGMSQWGTQRWALDASAHRWPWIVDHYYNDNGAGSGQRTAVMTSPLSLSAVVATPTTVAPGATAQLSATARNAAGAAHAHVLVGASLYRSGVGYVDDPAHDAATSLPPGDSAVARAFHVPVTTPPGTYDVLISLYLDVDENAAIGAGDVPLALVTVTGAIEVGGDRIYANGFEAAP